MNNVTVKNTAKRKNVFLWEVADAMGVCDMTVNRWLRHELPKDRYNAMMRAIDEIAARKEKE